MEAIDETLILSPSPMDQPLILIPLEIRFRRRYEIWYRDRHNIANLVDHGSRPQFSYFLPISLHVLAAPFTACQSFFLEALSALNLNVETHEFLAWKLSSLASEIFPEYLRRADPRCLMVADADLMDVEWNQSGQTMPRRFSRMRLDMWIEAAEVMNSVEADGPASRTATVIDRLKRDRFLAQEGEDLGICSVCLDDLSGSKYLMEMPCSHVFHETCILTWLDRKKTCPLCRVEI